MTIMKLLIRVFTVKELKRSDRAVRVGGSLGIAVGADDNNQEHNQIMYEVIHHKSHYDYLDACVRAYVCACVYYLIHWM